MLSSQRCGPSRALLGAWLGFSALAVLAGAASHILEPRVFLAVLAGSLGLALVLWDFRIGVLALSVLLPWMYSPHLPHGRSLSLVNLFALASLVSWGLGRLRHADQAVAQAPHPLQAALTWGYLLPIAWAGAMAYPHLSQAAANFPLFAADFSVLNFTIDRLIRPWVFPLWAFLLAQALRASPRPAHYLWALGLGALLPALLAIRAVWWRGADVTQRDSLLAGWGLHANEAGFMLAMAAAPLLAIALGGGRPRVRWLAAGAFMGVSLGLLATGTRGAVLALGVATLVLVLRRRQAGDWLWLLLGAAALALMLPEALGERLMLGLTDWSDTSLHNRADPLTQGRLSGWALLAPEVLSNPLSTLVGHGLMSTTWMPATTRGDFVYQHPHNLYLEVLLDVGVLGFALMAWAFWKAQAALWQLSQGRGFSQRPELAQNTVLRDYLSGAHAALFGLLAMGFTNLHYLPCPEQTAVWFSMAWAWAFWRPEPAGKGAPC